MALLALAAFAACGARADFAKTNPVTGETENYTWKFVGTDTWNGTGYWQDSDGNNPTGVPGKQGDSTFDPFLFDGTTININAGMAVDGWTLRMGLYNGANVSMQNLQKFQSESGTMWVTVDESSKVRINNVNDKYEGAALNLYSARESGIEWTCALAGTNGTGLPFYYYLSGNGTVAFTSITAENCSHTIKQAEVLLDGNAATGKGKRINSKAIVTFESSTQAFTADATIKVKYANGAFCKDVALYSVKQEGEEELELTEDDDIGDCELVQTLTGIVLYYVDYAYTPSINLNFTDSSANLTTEDYVGLAGYTASGSAWNNIAAAVGTTSGTIKMIDATGATAVNSGVSVQIATTRGSWACSSLDAATDLRQGYIDENSNNTTPTVTISGIPFSNYRVIVYHSTDDANKQFGYDTINGSNLTYVDGTLTTGTSDWGDTGDQNTSHPMEEGVNTLVSGVLSGSTATIVAHKGNSSRGCIAAIQIVEASNTSLEETGGYAAAYSQIVFKNTTLAELTGDTLSARFGGDWAGTAKTRKMTFNNFDRSGEESGTISCEAQVQHDSNVKGVLLTFTQVGDDVAVKTTGGKYKTGTVGESIADANDATGHYAIYNFALPRTPETSATIVWETGEFEMTKVGPDGNAYSFSSFGGLSINGDGNLVVDTANAQGAIINLPDTSKTSVSVLIKYSNLAAETGGNATLANCAVNSGETTYYLGARTITSGTLPLTAYFAGNAYPFDNATYGHGNVPSMDTGSGYFLFAHGSSNGTYAYSGETIGALDGGYNTQLKWGGYNITKVSIGGGFENNRAYCWKGNGTVIEKVAIFLGSIKTPSDLADYYFPSAAAKGYGKWGYAKAMLTRSGSGELAGGTYKLFDIHSGVNTGTEYDGNTTDYSLFGYTGSGVKFWKYLCYASIDDPVGWQAPGLALRFSASETDANKTIGGTFGPAQFAGLYVESGATGYSFTQNGSKRDTIFGDPSGGSAETWFVFDEPFEVQRNGTMWFAGTVNVTLAEPTDVLTLNTDASDGQNDCAPHIVASITQNENGVQVISDYTTAGGTLRMHGAGHLAAAKLVASGATLDFSDIDSRYNDETPFINCPLVIDGNTKFVFPENIGLPYTYKVATSITVDGTPTTEYTDANGNVFSVPLSVDTDNGTVTVSDDLTTASTIVVNGALTISDSIEADIVVNSTGTLTLAAGGSLSGTVTGSGTIVCNQGVDLSGRGFGNASGWTGKVQLTGDLSPVTDFDETVYGNANSTLEVVSGHVYMTAVTSLPGTVNVASGATLYVANPGLAGLSISGTNSGTINLQSAASLATLTLGDGIARGTLAYPASITTLNVSLTESLADDGEKSFSCGSATPTDATLTLTRADGTADAPIAGAIEGSTVSFAWTPAVSGRACWIDYEMDYESGVKTGFENSGSDTTDLHSDSGITGDDAFYNGMLYTYAHPWRDMTGSNAYPSSWTAVVRCTVPAYENAAIITFGTRTGGLIGLVAGHDPETEMKLVKTTGDSAFTVLQTMTVQDATTAQHVYVFEVETNSTIKVYCDGEEVLNETFDPFTLGGGIQVGSVHGGIGDTGIIRFAKNEAPANTLSETVQKNARIDCVRLFKGLLGPNAIRQLSVEMPAVKLYRATVAAYATTAWDALSWSPEWDGGNEYSKIILTVEGDAALTLPESITAEDFKIDVASGCELTLYRAAGGTTIATTNPMEIDNGTMYLADDSVIGDWQIGGTGAVRLKDETTITGSLAGTAKVKVGDGDTVTVMMTTGSIANDLTGDGTIVFQVLPASAPTFSSWTGSVVLPAFTAEGFNFNSYGGSGSKVVLSGYVTGWVAPGVSFNPEIVLNGADLAITAMSSYDYTFAKVSGSGDLSFATEVDQPASITISEVAEDYNGEISNTTDKQVVIGTLARPKGTEIVSNTKLLATTTNVVANVLTVDGDVPEGYALVTKDDAINGSGIYVVERVRVSIPSEIDGIAVAATAVVDGKDVEILTDEDGRYVMAPIGTQCAVTFSCDTHQVSNGTVEFTVEGATYVDTYQVSFDLYVASFGSSKYTTLGAAIDAWAGADAEAAQTPVSLVTNITYESYETVTIPANNNYVMTLDGQGFELCAVVTIAQSATLSISNTTFTGSMTVNGTLQTDDQISTGGTFEFASGATISMSSLGVQPIVATEGPVTVGDSLVVSVENSLSGNVYPLVATEGSISAPAGGCDVTVYVNGVEDTSSGWTLNITETNISLVAMIEISDGAGTYTVPATVSDSIEPVTPGGLTYAQAYALGVYDPASGESARDVKPTIELRNGLVHVTLADEVRAEYTVTLHIYECESAEDLASGIWSVEPVISYEIGSEEDFEPASETSSFYKVGISIKNKQL